MSRLYDRMMRDWKEGGYYFVQDFLPWATVVEASNVASYYAEHILHNSKSRLSLVETSRATGFLVPFWNAFFEWRGMPSFYKGEPPYYAIGWQVLTMDRLHMEKVEPGEYSFDDVVGNNGYGKHIDDVRWICFVAPYVELEKNNVYGPPLLITYALDFDAEMVTTDNETEPGIQFDIRRELVDEGEDPMDFVGSVAAEFQVVLMATSFMHCKNVAVDANVPPVKLSKRHRRKYGSDLITYYTLAIEPMREVLRRESGDQRISAERALHICRGHFAAYSPEKPLFGKYTGTFWKPQHVRGSKVHGEVVKDYAVKAPTE